MKDLEYFDYESAAQQAHLSRDQLRMICDVVRRDYPGDQMLFELHVLRACNAIRDGRTTYDQIISETAST
jgi:hypothetical protein